MTSEAELVLTSLRNGRFILTQHARVRMKERKIRFDDITHCAQTMCEVSGQENGNYKVKGEDLDGNDLTVIAAYDGSTVVVTLL